MTLTTFEVSNVVTEPRVMVPASAQGQPSFGDVTTELKGGLWAVALALAMVWFATGKAREVLTDYFTEYAKKHINLLDVVKETSTENNKLIKDILVKVDEHTILHTKNGSPYRPPTQFDNLKDD